MSSYKKLEILTIVPARGGSKGVIKKNIRNVANRPLIEWTIEAIKNSYIKNDFYISTDDNDILKISKKMDANVIRRPNRLATDNSQAIDVIFHAISYLKKVNKKKYDYILLLQPTSPMRSYLDINNAINILEKDRPDSLVSVYKVEDAHPARMYSLINNLLYPLQEEGESTRRQDLPAVYHRNGSIYASTVENIFLNKMILSGRIAPLIMPKERSINIDDEEDLLIADYLMKKKHNDKDS